MVQVTTVPDGCLSLMVVEGALAAVEWMVGALDCPPGYDYSIEIVHVAWRWLACAVAELDAAAEQPGVEQLKRQLAAGYSAVDSAFAIADSSVAADVGAD